jgi:hypothetical protein
VLLDIIATRTPVEQWPTQLAKRRRTDRAREATQTAAVARDRPQPDAVPPGEAPAATVLPLRRQEHARQVQDAVDAERRRRREQAVPVAPSRLRGLGTATAAAACWSLPTTTPRAEDDQAIGHGEDAVQAMADEQDRLPLVLEVSDQLIDLLVLRHAQGGGGLVHEEDPGFLRQGPRDGDGLALASRQLADPGPMPPTVRADSEPGHPPEWRSSDQSVVKKPILTATRDSVW